MLSPYSPAYSLLFISSFFIAVILIAIVSIIFWLWMLIDLLKRKNLRDKTAWTIILIFLGALGAIFYFFLVYRKIPK